jgi:hypothetical protein
MQRHRQGIQDERGRRVVSRPRGVPLGALDAVSAHEALNRAARHRLALPSQRDPPPTF